MEKLPMCRICLAEDVRMYVVINKKLRELYEKLADNPFVTQDSRPMLVCFFCCTQLKKCWRFQRKCLEAEELFAQMMNEDNEPNLLLNASYPEFCNGFIQSPMVYVSIEGECQTESDAIKEELPAVCERLDNIIEPKEEYQSNELELQNQANSFSDVDDIPAQHSDSDGDVPLMECKTEIEEEQEISRKKWRAGDSQRTPSAMKPNQHPRRSTAEDVNTEEQTERPQSGTAVIQIPQNCVFTTVTKCKEPLPYTAPILTYSSLDTIIFSKGIDGDADDINRSTRLCVQRKPFKCDVCQRCFSVKSKLIRHIRLHTGEKPFKCDVCQRCFSLKSNLIRHIRTHTGEKPFKCDVCQSCFSVKSKLIRHIRLHTGEKPFKCDVCQRCFSLKSNLIRHIRMHTSEKPFKCDVCHSCFSDKSKLIRHIRAHTGENPFKCDVCQRCFSLKSNLIRHIRTHTGEKPFKCDGCQSCFSDKSKLIRHIRAHTGEKPFKCDVCQRCFSLKSNLICHIRTHTGEKPFKCDVCQSCFSDKSKLIRHIRAHTGEKPFKCDVCQRCFSHKDNLTRHILTHTGEKPFICDICQCCFSRKGNLTNHIRTHTCEKPFKCDVCQRGFSRKSSLTRHIRMHTRACKTGKSSKPVLNIVFLGPKPKTGARSSFSKKKSNVV